MDLAIDQGSHGARWSLTRGLAELGIAAITDVAASRASLARLRCGHIVIRNGHLQAIQGRWWPYCGNLWQVWWDTHSRSGFQDSCDLFYHSPFSAPGFLTLDYVRSGARTSLTTLYAAALVLDEIARLRRAHAIVCNVTNRRISDRLLQRWGWHEHCQQWSGRHFIKRFYGHYPEIDPVWRERLNLGELAPAKTKRTS
jgi:hypothetical protein